MAYDKKVLPNKTLNALRTLPNSYEAEQATLGAIITDNEIADDIIGQLSEADFYTASHKIIFEEIIEIKRSGKPIDIIMLSNNLSQKNLLQNIGGVSMLAELTDALPSVANYKYYVNIIKQKSTLRKVIRACNDIVSQAYEVEDSDKVVAYAEAKIFELSNVNGNKSDLRHISDIAVEVLNKYSEVYQTKTIQSGLKVGLDNLDDLTNGFLPGQMLVLAARPGCGKTSFCMHILANICRQQPERVVACFNLEMSDTELVQRIITNITQTETKKFLKGEVSQPELDKMWQAGAVFEQTNIYVDDSAVITSEQIMSKCRKLKAKKGRLDFIIIDYLQLMSSMKKTESKQQEVTLMSRNIKILAKELQVPVLILSQMSRSIEKRSEDNPEDAKPKLSDLRESGAIEQDADMVMFLTEGDFELFDKQGVPIYLNVAKHRNGSTGELAFRWDKATMTYYPVFNIVVKKDEDKTDKTNSQETNENTNNSSDTNTEYSQNVSAYDDVPFDSVPLGEPIDDIFEDIQGGDISFVPRKEEE